MRGSTTRRWALPAVLVLVAAAVPTVAGAAQRCVLGEYFNATW